MNENGGLFLACLVMACIVAWLLLTPAAPMQDAPAQPQERARYTRNADGSVSGYGRAAVDEAIRNVHRQMAENPGGFTRYRKCQQECGYEPRDTDTPGEVTEGYKQELRSRRDSCIARGIECKYPGHPYGEMAQPQQQSPWRATRNGREEREER